MLKRRIIGVAVAMLMLLVTIAGCTQGTDKNAGQAIKADSIGAFPVEVTDYFGNTITIESQPQSIVSLAPANTEILFALGLGDRLVGVTEYCNFPEEALSIDKVGDFNGPNAELVIQKKPDIILSGGYMHEDMQAQFESLGIVVLPVESVSFENVYASIATIGKAMGTSEEADALISDMQAQVEKLKASVKGVEKKKVFYVVDATGDEIWTAGKGTFIHDIIEYAGCENIAAESETPWTTISAEKIIQENPDVIVMAPFAGDFSVFTEDKAFQSINAVKDNCLATYENTDIISRGGPRLVEALKAMIELLHPDLV